MAGVWSSQLFGTILFPHQDTLAGHTCGSDPRPWVRDPLGLSPGVRPLPLTSSTSQPLYVRLSERPFVPSSALSPGLEVVGPLAQEARKTAALCDVVGREQKVDGPSGQVEWLQGAGGGGNLVFHCQLCSSVKNPKLEFPSWCSGNESD